MHYFHSLSIGRVCSVESPLFMQINAATGLHPNRKVSLPDDEWYIDDKKYIKGLKSLRYP